jgi:hypothetical protein
MLLSSGSDHLTTYLESRRWCEYFRCEFYSAKCYQWCTSRSSLPFFLVGVWWRLLPFLCQWRRSLQVSHSYICLILLLELTRFSKLKNIYTFPKMHLHADNRYTNNRVLMSNLRRILRIAVRRNNWLVPITEKRAFHATSSHATTRIYGKYFH